MFPTTNSTNLQPHPKQSWNFCSVAAMSIKNRKRPRTDEDTNQHPSHNLRRANPSASSSDHPEHLSAFAAIRARRNASTSDARPLPERNGPSDGADADDGWSDRGEESGDDNAAGAEARPATRSSLESWKALLDARPGRGSFSEVDGGERVRLKAGQKLCVAGQYYLRVLSGDVLIYGSSVLPGSSGQKVVAPSIEPLPVIRAGADGAEIEISSVVEHEDFETLAAVSPLFRGLWPGWSTESLSRPKRTYHIVRLSCEHGLKLNTTDRDCSRSIYSSTCAYGRGLQLERHY